MKTNTAHLEPDVDELLERITQMVKKGTRKALPTGKQRIANHLIRVGARRLGLLHEKEAA